MSLSLALPTAPHTAIYRAAVNILRSDPTLRVVHTWRTWVGGPTDVQPISPNLCPAIGLFPAEGPDSFYGPSGFRGNLVITVVVAVTGTNVDNLMNLYHAVRKAFYPEEAAARTVIRKALLAAGCLNEDQPLFTQTAYGVEPVTEGLPMLLGQGRMLFQPRVMNP